MDGLVKLIFAFWIIVIVGVVIAAIMTNPWLLIAAVIIIIAGIIYAIKNNQDEIKREKQDEEKSKRLAEQNAIELQKQIETENHQHEKALKSKKYLEENSKKVNELINKYYQSVYNFVENLHKTAYIPFLCVDKSSSTQPPMDTNIIISLFWNSASLLLKTKFKYDGFGYYDYSSVKQFNANIDKIQKLTQFFVAGLKRRIKEQNEWDDEYTLSIVLYMIIRNNVTKYYHNLYLEEISYENIEDYCRCQTNSEIEQNKIPYTFYYIYKTDLALPFVATFNDICLQIETKQENEDLESSLFGKSKEPTDDDLPKEFRLVNLPMKPIEKVDVMTGEEFERFMEKYFIKKGYKVTRTPLSGDYGIDLTIEHEFGKIGVQLKCYFDKVPLKAVQEVVAGLNHYGLNSGMVITNSYFQPSAKRLANDNKITLWDRDILIEKLEA